MSREKTSQLIPDERIIGRIYVIRGRKVIFDFDLAGLYQVPAKVLNQAVRRNQERFPEDFMFQLTKVELENWRSQIVTSNSTRKMALRYPPHVFTEHGVAMLSSVLRSQRAVQVNIAIVRTFTKLREMLATHIDLKNKLAEMEKKYDKNFRVIFTTLQQLLDTKEGPEKTIGFRVPNLRKKR